MPKPKKTTKKPQPPALLPLRDNRAHIEGRAIVGNIKGLPVGAAVPPAGSRLKGAGKKP